MDESLEKLREIYHKTFLQIDSRREPPAISVSFYPYVNVNHTIRVRNGRVFVRLATLLAHAPEQVHRALAVILVSKLLRKRVPVTAEREYKEYISAPDFREMAMEHKRNRGRKRLGSSRGEVYDLEEIFTSLNYEYFESGIPKPDLSWSAKPSFRRLGHYDEAHEAIIISKSLDSRSVPAFVVEFVVFHEMLHIKHPTVHRNGRRYSHTAAFRRDERRYDHFDEAESWIERNFEKIKSLSGKSSERRAKRRYWGLFD